MDAKDAWARLAADLDADETVRPVFPGRRVDRVCTACLDERHTACEGPEQCDCFCNRAPRQGAGG